MQLLHNILFYIFYFLYKYTPFQTYEDKHHNESQKMTTVKLELKFFQDYFMVNQRIYGVLKRIAPILETTSEAILSKTSKKMHVYFERQTIYIAFNHYHVSGPFMFRLLNEIMESKSPTFLDSNFAYGLFYLPLFWLYLLQNFNALLIDKTYPNYENHITNIVKFDEIDNKNKRFSSYLQILQHLYKSVHSTRPLTVGLSIAFNELSYLNNNVGLIFIEYDIDDTVETLQRKIESNFYQCYVTNFLLNCPSFGLNVRKKLDCILSSMYLHTDVNMKVGWGCGKPPTEQVYIGSVSMIGKAKTIVNSCYTSCSKNYKDEIGEQFI